MALFQFRSLLQLLSAIKQLNDCLTVYLVETMTDILANYQDTENA